ncbi:MAG TPA: ParB/RepB/Spo0J family partition protein [Chloroflexia bacterium]|nr:ParB/RepB/Spo0J family partition protein [Chloroflexia bacterium]
MAIKGRHNRIPAQVEIPGKLAAETNSMATRRSLFATRAQSGNWVLAYVSPDRIDPNPNQPRRQIERAALEELKQSIASRGILQPLLGAKSSESRVRLIAGHRRLQAAKELGLARVPVVLVDQLNEEETVIDAVIENIQRRNLEAWEEGVAYAQLADEFGWTHDEIGRKIGKSRSYVSTRIRAAEKLSPLVKEVLATGNWSILSKGKSNKMGTLVPASDKNHNQVGESQLTDESEMIAGIPGAASPINNVEVIRRLTALSFVQQENLLRNIEQRVNAQTTLSVRDVIEMIKTNREGEVEGTTGMIAEYQLSFVDLDLEDLGLFHRWTGPAKADSRQISVEELDRLIDLYERDLDKLRRVRAEKSQP